MTVHGLESIREYLGGFSSNYVIIGGSATNMNLEEGLLEGRTTADIDKNVRRRIRGKNRRVNEFMTKEGRPQKNRSFSH